MKHEDMNIVEACVLDRLTHWAEEHELIRCLILTSSRADPHASRDHLSDFDVILVVSDPQPFTNKEDWLRWYGPPLVEFRDRYADDGLECHKRLVLYEGGTKVDYTIWTIAYLKRMLRAPRLDDSLDVGYRLLVDKDGLARGLKPPSYTAHIPPRPSEREFLDLVEEFWWETTYVAKNLWRDELLPARYSFDVVIKHDLLLRLLEWYVETEHDWALKPGNLGRYLKQRLPPEIWMQLEQTFVDAEIDENWEALFTTTELFRTTALAVASRLGFDYPEALDQGVVSYLSSIRALERE